MGMRRKKSEEERSEGRCEAEKYKGKGVMEKRCKGERCEEGEM